MLPAKRFQEQADNGPCASPRAVAWMRGRARSSGVC